MDIITNKDIEKVLIFRGWFVMTKHMKGKQIENTQRFQELNAF